MKTRSLRVLAIGVLVVGLLAGCATPAANREDLGGLVRGDNPEYFSHPLRVIALGFNAVGYGFQYGLVEPLYMLLLPTPVSEVVGLSLEERRYLAEREEAWRTYKMVEEPQPIR